MSFLANYITTFIKQQINNIKLPEIPKELNAAPITLTNVIPTNITTDVNNVISYDNGFILMSVATLLMFINHIFYMFYVK